MTKKKNEHAGHFHTGLLVSSLSLALTAVAADPAHSGDRLGFPSYEQRVTLTFASDEAARQATCRVAPLPDNARLSFGTRWDDTSSRHVPKAKMLNAARTKGTFYLVGGCNGMEDLARTLCSLGHAVGNHTMTHPHVLQLTPNAFFRQILQTRIRIECAVDRTIKSYVAPFGWQWNTADVAQMPLYAELLVDTGHYVTGDNPKDRFGIARDVWYPAHRFSADDRNPSAALFRANSAKMLEEALADPLSPRLTLGTHSTCSDAGNEIQRQEIVRLCQGRDWIHQSDWEFGAYRYEALNGKIEKTGVAGRTATFVVTRFAPSSLAADVPLSLIVEPAPVGGLEAGARGTWRLPHAPGRAIVTAVDAAADDGASQKFQGLKLSVRVRPETNAGELVLVNGGREPLAAGMAVLYIPPVWKTHRHTATFPSLAPGATFRETFALGERARADYAEDAAFAAGSVDFSAAGRFCRLWATCEIAGEGLEYPVPRDTALVSRPLPEPLDGSALAAASMAGAPLPDGLGWTNSVTQGRGVGYFILSCSGRTPENLLQANHPWTRYFVWDFEAKRAGKVRFHSNVFGGWYVNGRNGRFREASAEVDVHAGTNRIIVWDSRMPRKYLPVLALRKECD